MALTLPYPDLVFVPLDILTAEEMNEIVANYTAIADQFPIAAANVNTESFKINPQYMQTKSAQVSLVANNTSGFISEIEFDEPFLNIPIVTASVTSASPVGATLSIADVTTTAVRVVPRYVQTGVASTYQQAQIIAIDPTQPPIVAA